MMSANRESNAALSWQRRFTPGKCADDFQAHRLVSPDQLELEPSGVWRSLSPGVALPRASGLARRQKRGARTLVEKITGDSREVTFDHSSRLSEKRWIDHRDWRGRLGKMVLLGMTGVFLGEEC